MLDEKLAEISVPFFFVLIIILLSSRILSEALMSIDESHKSP